MDEKQIKLVHLQITKNCNLRCWFCGQWGRKGFFSDSVGKPMILSDWTKVIDSLIVYRNSTGVDTEIILWGGEPLVSPYFVELVKLIQENGFKVGIVTNGTLLDKFDICKTLDKIYVSIDGNRKIHDSIRGKGVFDKVMKNLSEYKNSNITVMTVLTKEILEIFDELPEIYKRANAKNVLLQQMITLNKNEIDEYKGWLKNTFNIEATYIDSWQSDYEIIKPKKDLEGVTYMPHSEEGCCLSPFNHIHVSWNGNVMYCTDFYDFSAGNVKEQNIVEIFNNAKSEKFRKEITANRCVTCKHCSWKTKNNFSI